MNLRMNKMISLVDLVALLNPHHLIHVPSKPTKIKGIFNLLNIFQYILEKILISL